MGVRSWLKSISFFPNAARSSRDDEIMTLLTALSGKLDIMLQRYAVLVSISEKVDAMLQRQEPMSAKIAELEKQIVDEGNLLDRALSYHVDELRKDFLPLNKQPDESSGE